MLTKRLSDARRVIDLERRSTGETIPGDFSGSVIGTYLSKNEDGTVTISYNSKEYIARAASRYMAVKGDIVTLSYFGGAYLASW